MEAPLRCNNTACRALLAERAVVTTCSHIFCVRCANETGLSRSIQAQRQCPACKTPLADPDDAVTTALKPTEEYKTSVLSGLEPSTIMECAGRAVAFWTYQSTQEIKYQEFLCKNLTEKYQHAHHQLDRIVNDANDQLQTLQNKISSLTIDNMSLNKKNEDLIGMYRDKAKKHAQTQHLYDTLKKRTLMSQVETAASDNVAQTLKSLSKGGRPGTYNGTGFGPTGAPGSAGVRDRQANTMQVNEHGVERLHPHQRAGSSSHKSGDVGAMPPPDRIPLRNQMQNITSATPFHRTQLPGASRPEGTRSQIPMSTSRPSFLGGEHHPPGTAKRNSLGSSHFNRGGLGNANGYGIMAGMKVGSAPGTAMSHSETMLNSYGTVSDAHMHGLDTIRSYNYNGGAGFD